jgi:putative membrane-bound dehydrogenase-like protein
MRPRLFLLVLVLSAPAARAQAPHGLRLPPGFEAAEFADGRLANDIYCLTFDPRGRIVVSGRGYIRTLIDDDGDGKADRAVEFAPGPKDGAMGMLWEGDTLYVTGDGGLRRYRDRDGDGKADGPSELIRAFKTGGEHDAHDIRRGPDGWLYVLCGNMARVDARHAELPTSPVREPVAGCVVRFTPDLKKSEIFAHGFRNAYGMDFHLDGELFTYDSDNERCVSLPWYEPTRLYHVIPGGHHGWLSPQRGQFWRMPPYFLDVVAPVATLGRGSPTGVACYRHTQFPERYRGGLLACDWTFGKIHFVALSRSGASYTGKPEVFVESVGDHGFAPTALAVQPKTGDLYVSVGGRGTRGAVYRIRHTEGFKRGGLKLLEVRRRTLDWRKELAEELPRQAQAADARERLHALAGLRRHFNHFPAVKLLDAARANWDHPDRYVRQATAALLAALPRTSLPAPPGGVTAADLAWTTLALTLHETAPGLVAARSIRLLFDGEKAANPATRLDAVRLIQLSSGGLGPLELRGTVWEGYAPRKGLPQLDEISRQLLLSFLRQSFPSGNADLDRELTRTLAMLEDDHADTLAGVARCITDKSDPLDDLHHLIVIARLRAARPKHVTATVANALLALDRKLAQRGLNRDLHWPLRVAELHKGLSDRNLALNAAMLRHDEFGRPDHALFAKAPGFDREKAAERFLQRAEKDRDFRWSADLVEIVASLPEERSGPVLRKLLGKAGVDAALLPLLARRPRPEDRARFVTGLTAARPATVLLCLDALRKLGPKSDGAEALALLRALGQTADNAEGKKLRAALVGFLAEATGQKMLGDDRQAWAAWFAKAHPDLAARLENPDGVDVAAWRKRLARIDWARGDAGRGKAVFVKANCAACHSGSQAMGPDLAGVAGRFARDDLFAAILQPSRDVSPRYQMTLIETAEGKLYQGLVVYEAVDSVILQTGASETVRLDGKQVASRRLTSTSLMPAGLLDALTDAEIADLYEHLRRVGKGGTAPR